MNINQSLIISMTKNNHLQYQLNFTKSMVKLTSRKRDPLGASRRDLEIHRFSERSPHILSIDFIVCSQLHIIASFAIRSHAPHRLTTKAQTFNYTRNHNLQRISSSIIIRLWICSTHKNQRKSGWDKKKQPESKKKATLRKAEWISQSQMDFCLLSCVAEDAFVHFWRRRTSRIHDWTATRILLFLVRAFASMKPISVWSLVASLAIDRVIIMDAKPLEMSGVGETKENRIDGFMEIQQNSSECFSCFWLWKKRRLQSAIDVVETFVNLLWNMMVNYWILEHLSVCSGCVTHVRDENEWIEM